jgi:hypothetical protein
MCRIPKVVIVAPSDVGLDLRKKLGSLEYDIAAVVRTADDASGITADIAVTYEPDEDTLLRLRELGFKTVAVGGTGTSADMSLLLDDAASFKTHIWELFKPQ